ncbi:MAG TPA: right-handed parallel beta-helix repeat-containing protein [bacterium]
MLRRILGSALVATIFLAGAFSIARAATLNVPSQYSTIQAAIAAARSGDNVVVASGVYSGPIYFGAIAITVSSSQGPERTIIKGTANAAVVTFGADQGAVSTLSGFTIMNGGGASTYGGGIATSGSSPVIQNCIIQGNLALRGGGIYMNGGTPTVLDTRIVGNSTVSILSKGGGICTYNSSPRIERVRIIGNNTGDAGGGLFLEGGSPVIVDSVISDNTAVGQGGGLRGRFTTLLIQGTTISDNKAGYSGGGIDAQDTTLTLEDSTVTGNRSVAEGGGIYATPTATISDCTISGNTTTGASGRGGGLYLCGTVTVARCRIQDNTAYSGGGGIATNNGLTISVRDSLVTGNVSTTAAGGGVSTFGPSPATLVNCTVAGNTAAIGGGGIACVDVGAGIVNSILWGNTAPGTPDEVYLTPYATLTAQNSIVEGGWPGAWDVDPHFSGMGNDPYTLSGVGVPPIDSGSNADAGSLDLLGMNRIQDGDGDGLAVVDLGCYEYAAQSSTITIVAGTYNYVTNELHVEATTPLGAMDFLEIPGLGPLTWDGQTGFWFITAPDVFTPPLQASVCRSPGDCRVLQ